MLFSYLKLSIRRLLRRPFFAFINLAGLSVGFTAFFVLWQYSTSELNSDRQWKDWERICRIGILWQWTDDGENWESEHWGVTTASPAPNMVRDFPETEDYVRVMSQFGFDEKLAGLSRTLVMDYERPDQSHISLKQEDVVMADKNFFEFFSFPLIAGNPKTVLEQGNHMAISTTVAKKYFGSDDPIGKLVSLNRHPYVVAGVFEDLPPNTHFNCQVVLSNLEWIDVWDVEFHTPAVTVYLRMRNATDWSDFEKKINEPKVLDRYFGEAMAFYKNCRINQLVQPLPEIAFSKAWRGDRFHSKSETLLYIFRTVGIVVFLLALVNYIILNTSRTAQRQKEIGTRKITGAGSSDFAVQFAVETATIFAAAIGLSLTMLQGIKTMLYETLLIPVIQPDTSTTVFFAAVVLIAIAFTASYPTWLSMLHKPATLLSGTFKGGKRRSPFLSLVTFQFSIAIMLVVWGFLIYSQVAFLLSRDLGFKKDNVIVIEGPVTGANAFDSQFDAFRNEVSAMPQVLQSTFCHSIMGDQVAVLAVRRQGSNALVALDTNGGVDENFLPMLNIELVAGRNFVPTDSGRVMIVSEGALPRLGFESPQKALGSYIEVYVNPDVPRQWIPVQIIGVIKGYRMRPMIRYTGDHDLKADAGITLMYKSQPMFGLRSEKVLLRIGDTSPQAVVENAQKIFSELFPGNIFNWYFLDDNINRHYQNEKTWRNQVLAFTCIAIGIACLGLLAMIYNKVVEKTKEIGVRKVLGARLHDISKVLLSATMKQMVIAVVIGTPLAYLITQEYLEKFTERIEMEWWQFAAPVAILFVILFSTIASVLWRAAKTNPVDALKHE